MRARSITLRLALLFSTTSTVALLMVGLVMARLANAHFEETDKKELDVKMSLVQNGLAKLRKPADLANLDVSLADRLGDHEYPAVAVIDSDGRVLYASLSVVFPAALLDPQAHRQTYSNAGPTSWKHAGRNYRGIIATAVTGIAGQLPVTVLVMKDIESHHTFVAAFRKSLLLTILASIVLTAVLSWIAARGGLAPLREIARMARRISASRLGDRLPLDSVPAELLELARTFNEMLARLEDSFQRLSEFSSDLAHELRTPICNVMTQTQVAISKARSADEYREVLYSNLEEHERLARMITDMLFLAKADHGLIVPNDETVDLAAEARELFAFYEAYVDERGINLILNGEGQVRGDRLMIRRALSNLLSNAVRYTSRGGVVKVAIARAASSATELTVENPGQDIAPEHLPRLFDRFYQVDPSRQHASEGAGLGLAITKSIADAHQATIQVSSANALTRFVVVFPPEVVPFV